MSAANGSDPNPTRPNPGAVASADPMLQVNAVGGPDPTAGTGSAAPASPITSADPTIRADGVGGPDPTATAHAAAAQAPSAPVPSSAGTGASTTVGASPASGTQAAAMCSLLAQNWWAVAIRGAAAILFGLLALVAPGATILSLILFFSAYMLVDGVFGVVWAVRATQRHERWGLLILEGLANIATGVIAFLWPGLMAVAFVLPLAVWSLVTGALMLGAAIRLTSIHGRGWMVLSGVVSVLFGIALVVAPIVGAVVLTWWLGAYALAFGAMLLVLAFKLRARKDEGSPGSSLPQGA